MDTNGGGKKLLGALVALGPFGCGIIYDCVQWYGG